MVTIYNVIDTNNNVPVLMGTDEYGAAEAIRQEFKSAPDDVLPLVEKFAEAIESQNYLKARELSDFFGINIQVREVSEEEADYLLG